MYDLLLLRRHQTQIHLSQPHLDLSPVLQSSQGFEEEIVLSAGLLEFQLELTPMLVEADNLILLPALTDARSTDRRAEQKRFHRRCKPQHRPVSSSVS